MKKSWGMAIKKGGGVLLLSTFLSLPLIFYPLSTQHDLSIRNTLLYTRMEKVKCKDDKHNHYHYFTINLIRLPPSLFLLLLSLNSMCLLIDIISNCVFFHLSYTFTFICKHNLYAWGDDGKSSKLCTSNLSNDFHSLIYLWILTILLPRLIILFAYQLLEIIFSMSNFNWIVEPHTNTYQFTLYQ